MSRRVREAVVELRGKATLLAEGKEPRRLAELYVDAHGRHAGDVILASYLYDWYRYGDGCYRPLSEQRLHRELWEMLDRTEVEVVDKDGNVRRERVEASGRRVREVADALISVAQLVEGEAPLWIDGRRIGSATLSCQNGILDLETGKLSPSTPAYFATSVTGAPWDPTAPEPTEWLRFLTSLWADDDEIIRTLQMMFGYFLTNDTRQQKIFLLVGPKRSGKGTIARVASALLGPDTVANPTLGSLAEPFGLEPLLGAKVAIIGDARIGARTDGAAVAERLLSISGEDPIGVNRKFKKAVAIRLGVRFLIITNQLPSIADASGALASRFVIVPTGRSFYGAEDHGLEERLLRELPGILRWAVEGWRLLREAKRFEQPRAARQAMEDLEALSSPIGAFIGDTCVVGPGREVEVGLLYERWRSWCDKHGRKDAGTQQRFGVELRAAVPGLEIVQRRLLGNVRSRFYAGVGLV